MQRATAGLRGLPVIALLSATLLSLEMIWTRLFSAEFYYTFAFLILSLAIMGLGLGALTLRMSNLMARSSTLAVSLLLTGVTALTGPPLVFALGLDISLIVSNGGMLARFAATTCLLAAPYFFGGIALATILRRDPTRVPRLYMADLLGAAIGVLLSVWLMNTLGTPAATVASAAPVIVAAFMVAPGWLKLAPLVLAIGAIPLGNASDDLLRQEREERAPVIYEHWDAMAKLKVYDYGPEYRGINIDNVANTGVYGFDGNWDRDEPFEFGIDVGYLLRLFDRPTFLSLGAGGGSDVLQALQYGAGEVHAVEVNPHINLMLTEGHPAGYRQPPPPVSETRPEADSRAEQVAEADSEPPGAPWPPPTMAEFSGGIYNDPRVRVVTEDARAYVRRFQGRFDFIYSLSSNTFAAVASGSFAMAESYLFTTEAFRDYWRALSKDGFMMMEHQFYMPRLAASLADALDKEGVHDPAEHVAIYDLPKMRRKMILLSKRPLTDELRTFAFGELTEERFEDIHLLYPAPDGLEDNLVNRIMTAGWRSVVEDAPIQVSPTTDDRPFVGQMGRWQNLRRENLERMRPLEVFGLPLARMIVLTILAVVTLVLVPLNLLPYLQKGPKLSTGSWLYFFLIGAAFMAVEVVLIQQFTLFVGPAVYSIATILAVLLVASGLGSRFSDRVPEAVVFWGIATWIAIDIVLFSSLSETLAWLPLAARISLTAASIAPLGFLMGMPFPKGAVRVGELVDWGFAVNGAASVLGATAILLVAFSLGLSAALAVGAALYLAAFRLLSGRGDWLQSLDDVTGPADAGLG